MKVRERARWYRPIDAAVLRASVHTGDVIPRPWPDLDDDAGIEQWCAWLAQVWAQRPVAEAVAVASPVLTDRIEAVCAGLRPRAGQVRRLVLALARYLVRMRGRATPFGAFAGVTALRFGEEVSVRWTDCHQARTRADALWLADVIARLESCAALRLFAADSAAVLAQLTALASSREIHSQALTAASLVDLVCAMTGSRFAGMRWLIDHAELAGHAPVRDRELLRQALRLVDGPALHSIPSGPAIAAAWHTRTEAATRYASCLTPDATHVTPASVLVSLLHIHHVRAHGIDPDSEAMSHRRARAVALSWNARQTTTEEAPDDRARRRPAAARRCGRG